VAAGPGNALAYHVTHEFGGDITRTAAQIAGHLAEIARRGITEVIYQPTGPDIAGKLVEIPGTA
jgi:hypothetical protein